MFYTRRTRRTHADANRIEDPRGNAAVKEKRIQGRSRARIVRRRYQEHMILAANG